MLLEQEPTIVDGKSLLMVVNNDWTMIVEREQLWTMVVDNSCWQCEAQHCLTVCSTTLQQVVDNIDQVVHFCACREFPLNFKTIVNKPTHSFPAPFVELRAQHLSQAVFEYQSPVAKNRRWLHVVVLSPVEEAKYHERALVQLGSHPGVCYLVVLFSRSSHDVCEAYLLQGF